MLATSRPEALPIVRRQIREVLYAVASDARAACTDTRALAVYGTEPDGAVRPRLRALTPLAEGVDRLFAEVAAEIGGYEFDVALPFERAEYAKDFEEASRADLERWLDTGLAGGGCLEIDGARDADEEMTDNAKRSYEAVGRLVVRNCDLLVAVWNGGPSKGRGGTAEIVRFAARVGPPVWWIDAAGVKSPRLLRTMADLRWRDALPCGDAARRALSEIVGRDLIPPSADTHPDHGLIGRTAVRLGVRRHAHADPLLTYYGEVGRPRRAWLLAHRVFFRLVAGRPSPQRSSPRETGSFLGAAIPDRRFSLRRVPRPLPLVLCLALSLRDSCGRLCGLLADVRAARARPNAARADLARRHRGHRRLQPAPRLAGPLDRLSPARRALSQAGGIGVAGMEPPGIRREADGQA